MEYARLRTEEEVSAVFSRIFTWEFQNSAFDLHGCSRFEIAPLHPRNSAPHAAALVKGVRLVLNICPTATAATMLSPTLTHRHACIYIHSIVDANLYLYEQMGRQTDRWIDR